MNKKRIKQHIYSPAVLSFAFFFCLPITSCSFNNNVEKIVVVTNIKFDLSKKDSITNEGLTENDRMVFLINSINSQLSYFDTVIFNGGINYHLGEISEVLYFIDNYAPLINAKTYFLCGPDDCAKDVWIENDLEWNCVIETNECEICCFSANSTLEQNFIYSDVLKQFQNNNSKKIFVSPWLYGRNSERKIQDYFYDFSKDTKFLCLFNGFNIRRSVDYQDSYSTYLKRPMPIFDGGNFSFPVQNPNRFSSVTDETFPNYAWSFHMLTISNNSASYELFQPKMQYTSHNYTSNGSVMKMKLYDVSFSSIAIGLGICFLTVLFFLLFVIKSFRGKDK